MVKDRLPRKLALLPGLRWRGHMTVLRRDSDGYLVAFDAYTANPADAEHWIGDRATLTAEQIREWTGVRLKLVGDPL